MSPDLESFRVRVTSDYLSGFGLMREYKPLWIGRIVGPIFQGIRIQRSQDGKSYRPLSHIHNFGSRSDDLTLSLCQRLMAQNGSDEPPISNDSHPSRVKGAVEKLKRSSLLPTDEPWTASQLVAAIDRASNELYTDGHYPIHLYETGILAMAWTGNTRRAQELVEKYEALLRQKAGNRRLKFIPENLSDWSLSMLSRVNDKDTLVATVEEEISKHKAGHLPRHELTD